MRTMIDIGEFRDRLKSGKHKPQTGVRFVAAQQDVKASDDARTVTFVFSDNSVDRYGDTIDARGWVLDNYRSNPIALFGHDSGAVENVIGRAHNVRIEGQRLLGDIEFMEASVNPTAEAVFQMVKGGFLKTVSVGFAPIEWSMTKDKNRPGGVDFKKQELLEISIVPIPANPNALQQAKAAGIDTDRLGLTRTEPKISTKGMYEVSFLAHLLSDLGYLEDMVEWEEEYEGDGSDIAQRLTDAMKNLGQILVDMTIEEVAELIGDASDEPLIISDDVVSLEALTPAQKAIRGLARAAKVARMGEGRRYVLKFSDRLPQSAITALQQRFKDWLAGGPERALVLERGAELVVIEPPMPGLAPAPAAPLDVSIIDKAGKVLSTSNETALRSAVDCITEASNHIGGVLEACAPADEMKQARERRAREAEALRLAV